MDSNIIFSHLRDALVDLYPREEDSRVVAHDAGLTEGNIAFRTRDKSYVRIGCDSLLAVSVLKNLAASKPVRDSV